jgi:hypothetical protein
MGPTTSTTLFLALTSAVLAADIYCAVPRDRNACNTHKR